MITQLSIIFIIPLILSLIFTPFVIRLAKRIGAIDQPNERKVHLNPIPRLGGVSIYTSFFLSMVILLGMDGIMDPFSFMHPHMGVMLVSSLTIVLILGIWDDVHSLSPGKKFIGQCIAATIVYFSGFRISSITHPMHLDLLNLGILDFPATIIWIVGITNAFNLIDGLDGLASGVALIVSLTISAISFMKGDMTTAMMGILLAGAVLGFLRYNFSNARIFLGDSGSLFLGFTLAILSMQSSTKGSAAFSIMVPVLTLGLPIMDTLLSMARRFLKSVFPEENESKSFFKKLLIMFLPDRGHIHHQLIARGLSHQSAVLLLYIVSCVFGIGALAVTVTNNLSATFILIAMGIATFIGVSQLRYKEMAVLRNGVLLPLYEWPFVNSSLFKGFLDLAFIIVSYVIAYYLTHRGQPVVYFDKLFLRGLALMCGIQITVFYFGGLYKETFRQLGMGDLLRIFKTTTVAATVSWIILAFVTSRQGGVQFVTVILDYYILLSFVFGVRISFHVLNYLSKRDQQDGKKKILIYGADSRGVLIMEQLLNDQLMNMYPIGFMDDNPQLEGKRLNGYPIFGGHWKLQRLLNTIKIHEIIISNDSIRPNILNRLIAISRDYGIAVRRSNIHLEDVDVQPKISQQYQERFTFIQK